MKIRTGFVSNSSSSSFYIEGMREECLLKKAYKSLGRDVFTAAGSGLTVKDVAIKFFEAIAQDLYETSEFLYEELDISSKEEYDALLSAQDDIKFIQFTMGYCEFFYYNDNIVAIFPRNNDLDEIIENYECNYNCSMKGEDWPDEFNPREEYSKEETLNLIKD